MQKERELVNLRNKNEVEILKDIIRYSDNEDTADGYIVEFTGLETIEEKISFLLEHFDYGAMARRVGKNQTKEQMLEDDYWSLLTVIIDERWR